MENTAEKIASLSPMLRQYLDYKQEHSDCLLLFQVGDFYECFFDDAVTIAREINLTLTSRSKNSPDPVPMAGVPLAVVDSYLERLVKLGYSVAVVSQCESDETKSGIGRKLERVVTPGITLQCDLEGDQAPLVSAVCLTSGNTFDLAYSSVQSGEIYVCESLDKEGLIAELSKLTPAEIVIPREVASQKIDKRSSWVKRIEERLRSTSLKFRNLRYAETSDTTRLTALNGFSALAAGAKKAVRLLVDYVDETTVGVELPFHQISLADNSKVMSIDASARKTLEIIQNSKDGDIAGSLFGVLNHTNSIGGMRLLRNWLLNPLLDISKISDRQDAVEYFIQERFTAEQLASHIKYITDLERIAARIELNIVSPRELAALRDSLHQLPTLKELFLSNAGDNKSLLLKEIARGLVVSEELESELLSQLAESPSVNTKEGGIFRDGFSEELDRLRHIRAKGHSWIAELEASEKEKTGIQSLKIKYNAIQGYYIEVTKTNLSKVPDYYIKKQSVVGGERYITEELKEMEREVLSAESKQYALEYKMFEELRDKIRPYCPQLRSVYAKLCELDVLLSLASVAVLEGYVRPEISNDSILEIVDGRHPVVAELLKGSFVANSLQFTSDKQCAMLTGPNMGGKSTFLRQAGLIVVMAQIGSFVPAKKAVIGIVDKLFARMGASDDLLEGESTFMVEMREAAHILTNATAKSLLLIDEIGRGTATSDGRAIARAILEWIVEKIKCRTLFATHFHELTNLDCYRTNLENLSVGVVDSGEDILFTHQIKHGAANRSYGLEVAKLAGLPHPVIERARLLLNSEKDTFAPSNEDKNVKKKALSNNVSDFQYELFPTEKVVPPDDYQPLKELVAQLQSFNLNSMTPLEAMNYLNELQKKANEL